MSVNADIKVTNAATSVSFFPLLNNIHKPALNSDSPANSPYLPVPYKTVAPSVPGYMDIPPQRPDVDLGSTQDYYSFYLNDHVILKKCQLYVKLNSLVAGGSGVSPRYVDDVLCRAIEYIDFRFASDTIQRIYMDRWHFQEEHETPEFELSRRYRMREGRLTPLQRAKAATIADRWLIIDVPVWWTQQDSDSFHQYAAQRKIEIFVKWADKNLIFQQEVDTSTIPTPTGATRYKLDSFIRFHTSAITEGTKNKYLELVTPTGEAGWLYITRDAQVLKDIQLSGSGAEQTFKLDTFTKNMYALNVIVRPAANLVGSLSNNRWTERCDLASIKLDINGATYWPTLDEDFMKNEINGTNFLGNPLVPLYTIPLGTDRPDEHQHSCGGFEMSAVSAPTMTIKLLYTPAETMYAEVWGDFHNMARVVVANKRSAVEAIDKY
jgi:hypothetical protein